LPFDLAQSSAVRPLESVAVASGKERKKERKERRKKERKKEREKTILNESVLYWFHIAK